MTLDQGIIFAVLFATLGLFIWNRWRYDLVALAALLTVTLSGLIPAETAFTGLGHPAVVTVAAVLVISRGLLNAGVVDAIARKLTQVGDKPWVQVATLTGIVALCSGFMNNVGALALFMPVAIWMARQSERSPSYLLMPLAFGSLLGGTLTMIGTPPNIIIATYRREIDGNAFGMFDFLPVGLSITVIGVLFIALIGWRFTPKRENSSADELFEVSAYLTELTLPEGTDYVGRSLHDLVDSVRDEADVLVVGLVRDDELTEMPSIYKVLRADDILLVEADSDSLKTLVKATGLSLAQEPDDNEQDTENIPSSDEASASDTEERPPDHSDKHKDLSLTEAIVTQRSPLINRSASALGLRERYSVNILAVARQGQRLNQRLGEIRFAGGDILLVQAHKDRIQPALNDLGCLPLASRGLRLFTPDKVWMASGLFAVALALIAFEILPASVALVTAALVMVLIRLVPPGEIYDSVDLPVIVLLAAMIPIGEALDTTGGSQLIADGLLALGQSIPPAATLLVLMLSVMLLSNIINNAAAAVLAAPVAIKLAAGMDVSPDPMLMAVAISASCAFLTPIGHQSNTLVMEPGGYKFGDYWRLGLPMSILVIAISVPVILWVWPL
ncbi:SLC13 family permease [Saccharospirillum alexandrii]|uniref:SLC13 family permease n=1 Tax=Saccharospirillum alexandrii TaxID=2448477 RepID=UPI000FDC39C5|nr:SLC13 family permease [Saccharospirillum alexandrii]